jgi:Flp pilus assembly protein TadD
VALLSAAGASWAVDTPTPASVHQSDPSTDRLGPARAAIAQQRWDSALGELRKVQAEDSADWHNLMGYAFRKRAVPDLAASQRHYDAALRIDPDHKGALEYAGELALTKGDLATAEVHLARLVRLCAAGCEERADLEVAVARFKAEAQRRRP